MAAMKFYMTPGSCSTGIHIILEELEEVFEAHIVNLPAGDNFKPDYVAINPKSTIPALVRTDGSVLTEVPAIAYWLGRSRPRAKLWPSDLETETRLLEAMTYISGTVHGHGFARIFATPTFSRNEADQESVRALGRNIVVKGFAILSRILGEQPYLGGDFSVADPIQFYVAFWADKTGIALPANLLAHYRRMLARPVVQRVLREEGYNPATLGKSAEQLLLVQELQVLLDHGRTGSAGAMLPTLELMSSINATASLRAQRRSEAIHSHARGPGLLRRSAPQ